MGWVELWIRFGMWWKAWWEIATPTLAMYNWKETLNHKIATQLWQCVTQTKLPRELPPQLLAMHNAIALALKQGCKSILEDFIINPAFQLIMRLWKFFLLMIWICYLFFTPLWFKVTNKFLEEFITFQFLMRLLQVFSHDETIILISYSSFQFLFFWCLTKEFEIKELGKGMAAFSEGRGAPKGGKSWFAVESKTFEISIEEIRGKLRGVILERSKGFSSWIKFGEKSFSSLLEGVED